MTNARNELHGLVSLNKRAKAVLAGLAVGAAGLCLCASPAAAVVADGAPGAPQLVHVSSGDSTITLDFTAPSDGGSAIFGYEDSINNGLSWQPISTSGVDELSAIISGLHNGSAYTVELRAISDAGPGAIAIADETTPSTTPGVPTSASVAAGDGSATVSFTEPADNGGADIFDYQYSLNGGRWTPFQQSGSLARPASIGQFSETVTGLTNGSVYAVQVRAVNVRGGGMATDPMSITPRSVSVSLTGPTSSVTGYGRSVAVTGQATPGSSVQILFRQRGQADFVVRRNLTADANGLFNTAYTATDDYEYYASVGSLVTPTVTTRVAPTVVGPLRRVVRHNAVITLSGTGVPGNTVTLHFHKQGTPATDFYVVRDVVVASNGSWSRALTATTDYRFYATSKLNATVTVTYLVQAH